MVDRELDPTGAVDSRDRLWSSRGWAEAEECATEAEEVWRARKGLLVRNCSGEGVFRLLFTRDVGDRKEAPLNPNRDYYQLARFSSSLQIDSSLTRLDSDRVNASRWVESDRAMFRKMSSLRVGVPLGLVFSPSLPAARRLESATKDERAGE